MSKHRILYISNLARIFIIAVILSFSLSLLFGLLALSQNHELISVVATSNSLIDMQKAYLRLYSTNSSEYGSILDSLNEAKKNGAISIESAQTRLYIFIAFTILFAFCMLSSTIGLVIVVAKNKKKYSII